MRIAALGIATNPSSTSHLTRGRKKTA